MENNKSGVYTGVYMENKNTKIYNDAHGSYTFDKDTNDLIKLDPTLEGKDIYTDAYGIYSYDRETESIINIDSQELPLKNDLDKFLYQMIEDKVIVGENLEKLLSHKELKSLKKKLNPIYSDFNKKIINALRVNIRKASNMICEDVKSESFGRETDGRETENLNRFFKRDDLVNRLKFLSYKNNFLEKYITLAELRINFVVGNRLANSSYTDELSFADEFTSPPPSEDMLIAFYKMNIFEEKFEASCAELLKDINKDIHEDMVEYVKEKAVTNPSDLRNNIDSLVKGLAKAFSSVS